METVRNLPMWTLFRLATVTGVSAGWWIMAFVSAVVGAVAAVFAMTVVHEILKGRKRPSPITAEVMDESS